MDDRTKTLIKEAAVGRERPDGSPYLSLSLGEQRRLAELSGVCQREIQIGALEQDVVPEVYARNQASIPGSEQIRLLRSRVAVIGLGGLGGAVTEMLARVGIGALTLVDGDRFEESNLNRQLLSSVEALGRPKAEVAAERVAAVNPAVEARAVTAFLSAENSADILAGATIGVDCLDAIPSRFLLEQACRLQQIPLVTAAIGGKAGQATVIYPGDPGLRLVYGDPQQARSRGVEATVGTLPYAAVAMAAIECAEVVAMAAGRQAPLRHRLLLFDLADQAVETVSLDV